MSNGEMVRRCEHMKEVDVVVDTMTPEQILGLSTEQRARYAEILAERAIELEQAQDSKKSPYRQWLQVNNDKTAYQAEDNLIRKSATAYRVLRFLASHMDERNALICSYKVLEESLGLKRASLSNAVKLLKDEKYIDVKKSGTSNIYLINKTLYWKSWGKNYKYAEFDAKILVSQSEQEEKVVDTQKHKTAVIGKNGKAKTVKNTVVVSTDKPAEMKVADTEVKTEKFTVEDLANNVTTTDPEVQDNAEAMDTIQMVKDHYVYEDLANALAKLA